MLRGLAKRLKKVARLTLSGRRFLRRPPGTSQAETPDTREQILDASEERRARIKVFIVSYPKSGRTWLRFIIGKAICMQHGLDEAQLLNTLELTAAANLPIANFVHNGTDFTKASRYKYGTLETDKSHFAGKKVIFLIRDPRDTLVSSYFSVVKREKLYEGSISDFIRTDEFGIRRLIQFYNIWHENRHVPDAFMLLSYEEMHRDAVAAAQAVFRFMEIPIDDAIIRQAVEFSRFDNMQKLEKEGRYNEAGVVLRPGDSQDGESYKVRRGKIGGYQNYLTSDDVTFVNRTIETMTCPFLTETGLL